jgi:flagellin
MHRLEVNIEDMRATGVLLNLGGLSISSLPSAQGSISALDSAIQNVTKARGNLGAVQNRLSFSIRATGIMLENDQASDSAIRDADIAEEVSAFSRAQILSQSGLAIFSQANIQAASALNLI